MNIRSCHKGGWRISSFPSWLTVQIYSLEYTYLEIHPGPLRLYTAWNIQYTYIQKSILAHCADIQPGIYIFINPSQLTVQIYSLEYTYLEIHPGSLCRYTAQNIHIQKSILAHCADIQPGIYIFRNTSWPTALIYSLEYTIYIYLEIHPGSLCRYTAQNIHIQNSNLAHCADIQHRIYIFINPSWLTVQIYSLEYTYLEFQPGLYVELQKSLSRFT